MTDASQEAPKSMRARSDEAHDTDLLATLNARTARRQRLAIAGIGAVLLAGAAWYMFGTNGTGSKSDESKTIDTAGIVNRDLSQREFVAVYGNRLDAVARQQKELKDASIPRPELEQQMAALKAENQAMRTDGQAAIDAISAENTQLKSQLAANAQSTPAQQPLPPALGPRGNSYARGTTAAPSPSGSSGSLGGTPGDASIPGPAEVKLMSFSGDKSAVGVKVARPEAPPLVVEDSPEYLPPNSYAPARVIVGVDASAGVASQTDPLPVVLRITGPARSVLQNGKVLTTQIQGCVVNGAARGDLSSEKVYVKLARMTCDQPGGRVAVSEVKGFISFAGKSGVRGRVVSREGNLISQALLAGIVGGFGRGFSANANSVFSNVRTNANGTAAKLSAGDILGGGLGQGAGDAADTVSKYLIERAEQYQPVVEMPTGIDVEIVFLDGVYVRNAQ